MADTKNKDDKFARRFGAFWSKEGARGTYLSGQIEINGKKISVIMFERTQKSGNQPDWDLFLAQSEDISVLGKRNQQPSSSESKKSAPSKKKAVESDDDAPMEDVPF